MLRRFCGQSRAERRLSLNRAALATSADTPQGAATGQHETADAACAPRLVGRDDLRALLGIIRMRFLGNLIDKGVVISWRPWQVGLALLGVMIYVATTDWSLRGATPGQVRPFAQISQDNHEAAVWSIVFSGTSRLASSTSCELRVKDMATGRNVRLLDSRECFGLAPAFSPDGRTLAIGTNWPTIRLWDTETLSELEPLTLGKEAARSVKFSPDGSTLAVVTWRSRKITLYEWPGRRPIAVLDGHGGEVNTVVFSTDGRTLVTADSASEVCVWDVASRTARARWQAHATGISALVHAPNGSVFATASFIDGTVRLWDSADGKPLGSLPNDGTGVTGLAFSPDATNLVLSRADGIASLWELAPARQIGTVKTSTGSLQTIAFAGDGRSFATGGFDGSVRYWDVAQAIAGDPREP
jgi:WD40 repeat protein